MLQDSILYFFFPNYVKQNVLQVLSFVHNKFILECESPEPAVSDCYVHVGKEQLGKQQSDI